MTSLLVRHVESDSPPSGNRPRVTISGTRYKTVGPNNVVANHSVECANHLTHPRHDRDLRLLSGGLEAVMERLEPRFPIAGAHRRHVEHMAYARTTAPDATAAFELAAIKIIG